MTPEKVRADVADVLGEDPADLDDDENLVDRGLDSIRILMLSTKWHAEGVDTGFLDLATEPTIRAWARLAEQR